MDEPVPIDPERLLAQTAWVRRLARSLARDEASADDLVQETFVAALRRPPGGAVSDGRLRTWFGFVLRNMAMRRTRSEMRREEREQRSLDAVRTDSDERAEELEQLRAELFRHVKALPEPSRQVVLLRYFEELDSAEIARRLGVPDSTVRNRLKRALAELRARLEHEHGPAWRNLCLFVVPSTGAKVAAGSGAVAAAAGGLWIAGSALGLAAVVFVLWIAMHSASPQLDSERLAALPVEIPHSAEDSDLGSVGGRMPNSDRAADSTRTAEAGALRVSVSDSFEPPPTTPFAHGIIVYGTVRDENGEPIDRGGVGWTDEWGRQRGGRVDEGKYSANSLSPGLQVVRVFGPSCVEAFHEIRLAADQELQSFDFVLHRAHVIPVYLLDRDGKSLLEGTLGEPLLLRGSPTAVATHAPPPSRMSPSIETSEDSDDYHPEYTAMLQRGERNLPIPPGALGLIEIRGEPPYYVSLVRRGTVLATQRFELLPERVEFQVERSEFVRTRSDLSHSTKSFVIHDGIVEPLGPGQELPHRTGVAVHLHFLDESARPVMANFRLISDKPERVETFPTAGRYVSRGGGLSYTAHMDGTYDLDGRQPGRYVLQVTGTRDDFDPTFTHVGALPRRVELVSSQQPTEIVVQMVRVREILLRSHCAADEWFRWDIRTWDDLPVTKGNLIGHAPRSLELPPGKFVLRVRAKHEDAVQAEQSFEIGDKPVLIELGR